MAPAASIAPRAMAASFVGTFVSTTVGATLVAAYLEATDPNPTPFGTNAIDLLKALGWGALAGVVGGLFVMLIGAWLAMMLRKQLWAGRRQARLWSLLMAALMWVAGVSIGGYALGFSGLGGALYLVALPALVVALVLAWLFAPWVAHLPSADGHRTASR